MVYCNVELSLVTGNVHIYQSPIHKGGALDDASDFQPIPVVSVNYTTIVAVQICDILRMESPDGFPSSSIY